MLDRVGLVAARVALAAPEDHLDAYDALADMRVGLNLIELAGLARRVDPVQAPTVRAAMDAVARAYERRLAGAEDPADPTLLHAIDGAIANLALTGDSEPRQVGFAALVGLRRNLFPQAAPYAARAA